MYVAVLLAGWRTSSPGEVPQSKTAPFELVAQISVSATRTPFKCNAIGLAALVNLPQSSGCVPRVHGAFRVVFAEIHRAGLIRDATCGEYLFFVVAEPLRGFGLRHLVER